MHDLPSAGYFSYGVNGLDELIKLAEQIQIDYPDCVFFGGKLVFVDESWWSRLLHNNTVNLNLGVSLLGGLKYNFSPKIAIGIESGLHAGIRLGASESKATQFTMSDKSSTDLYSTKNTSTSTFFNTNLINAIWFSYKF